MDKQAYLQGYIASMVKRSGVLGRAGQLLTGSKVEQIGKAQEKLKLQSKLNPAHKGTADAVKKLDTVGATERGKVLATRVGVGATGAAGLGGYAAGRGSE